MGIVGSGGNAGAAIFSVFFVCFSYHTAFVLMGLSAAGGAFLSLLMKTQKLTQTYEDVELEVEQREQHESDQITAEKDNNQASRVEPPDLEKDFNDASQ